MNNRLLLVTCAFAIVGAFSTAKTLTTLATAQDHPQKQNHEKFQLPKNPHGKITPWQAMKAAEAKVGGHAFQALFEFDEGKWIYGIMVVKNHKVTEVDVDAMTGVAGSTESVTPSGEAAEVKDQLQKVMAVGG